MPRKPRKTQKAAPTRAPGTTQIDLLTVTLELPEQVGALLEKAQRLTKAFSAALPDFVRRNKALLPSSQGATLDYLGATVKELSKALSSIKAAETGAGPGSPVAPVGAEGEPPTTTLSPTGVAALSQELGGTLHALHGASLPEYLASPITRAHAALHVLQQDVQGYPAADASGAPGEQLALPGTTGPADGILQLHFVGKSVHADLRVLAQGCATGWRLDLGRDGALPSPVTSVDLAKQLAAAWAPSGSRAALPLDGVAAVAKGAHSPAWFKLEAEAYEPGEVGSGPEVPGVVVTVDRFKVEPGMRTEDVQELFIHGGSKLAGILTLTKSAGGWTTSWGGAVPQAVNPGRQLPPEGQSWLPQSLAKVVPAECRYWAMKGDDAREAHALLQGSRFFNEGNVQLVDGQLTRVVTKTFVYEPPLDGRAVLTKNAEHWSVTDLLATVPTRKTAVLVPFTSPDSWQGVLEQRDSEDVLFVLDAPQGTDPVALAKRALALKADYLLGAEQSDVAEAVFGELGRAFTVPQAPGRIYVASWGVAKADWVQKATHSFSRCMTCRKAEPQFEVKWAEGMAHAWFCSKCFEPWYGEHRADVDYLRKLTQGRVAGKFGEAPGERVEHSQKAEGSQPQAEESFTQKLHVVKAGAPEDERYVLGVVLEPDVVDAQNDTYDEATIRDSAHKFMQEYRNTGLMHRRIVNGDVKILESFIAPADFTMGDQTVKKGTWLMAVRVLDDGLWDQVKNGELTGFSIGGNAIREPA